MGQSMVYISYDETIQSLRTYSDQLLLQILSIEIGMNRRKQQNQQPHEDEINSLHSMIKKLFQILAEINACQYLQQTNELYNSNDYYYKQMCMRYYQYFLLKFNLKLKAKRLERIKRIDNEIDFTISR